MAGGGLGQVELDTGRQGLGKVGVQAQRHGGSAWVASAF
jgi:hypothetical protein